MTSVSEKSASVSAQASRRRIWVLFHMVSHVVLSRVRESLIASGVGSGGLRFGQMLDGRTRGERVLLGRLYLTLRIFGLVLFSKTRVFLA